MKEKDIKIDLGPVQETLLIPLWARAKEAEKKNPIVLDNYAKDIIRRIDYDFSKFETEEVEGHQFVWPIRAYNFDCVVQEFLKDNSNAIVVNIGAGLDTTFQRIDNGSVQWINIDLPDVITLRKKLIPDSEREITIAKSVFDFTWMESITKKKNQSIMFMAAGVLCYFTPKEVETILKKLAESYPFAHLIFDSMSWLTVWGSNRALMKKSGIDPSSFLKWHLNRASQLKKWVSTVKIINEYPMFSRVEPKEDWDRKLYWGMKIADLLHLYQMVHIQFS